MIVEQSVFRYIIVTIMLVIIFVYIVMIYFYNRNVVDSVSDARLNYISALLLWLLIVLLPSPGIDMITWESVGMLVALASLTFFALYEKGRAEVLRIYF